MLALDELIQKDDNVVDIDGIKIAYEPGLERYMQDSMVDYARIKGYFVKVQRRLRC